MNVRSFVAGLVAGLLLAAPATAITLEQAMADPDWIGPPVEEAWWSLDGRSAYYRVKRPGSALRDTHRVDLGSGRDVVVPDDELAGVDGPLPVVDQSGRHALFLRNGDLFLRDLRNGRLRQFTRGLEELSSPRFGARGEVLVLAGSRWLVFDGSDGAVGTLADLRFEPEPDSKGSDDLLRQDQLRLFDSLRRQREDRAAQRAEDTRLREVDDSRSGAAWYLGDKRRLVSSEPSPDLRHLVVVTEDASAQAGDRGRMPLYVTESGYTEIEDVRTRVGRNPPGGHAIELLDLERRRRVALDLSGLPGIGDDPLADLRAAAGEQAGKAPEQRPVTVAGVRWNGDGSRVALQLRAVDNKDRWLVTLEPARSGGAVAVQHRLTDAAWINWAFNEFDWLPDGDTLWLQSEHDGYGHLYLKPVGGALRALTSGTWEAQAPVATRDGRHVYFIANREHPTAHDVYRVGLDGEAPLQLSRLQGVERFVLSADQRRILLVHSRSHVPAQLSVVGADGGRARSLTDTRTAEYRAIDWPPPEFVAVPSSKQAQPIWSKLYRPARMEPGRRYPAVLFVHGAGYLQNTHRRFPYYFREQMFHQVLADAGFVVLDMDYRASAGYGRDWRTAIYRQMGHPELEDLIDGVDWLVAEQQVDGNRIGVYGGSYGGFMTLMALFRAPDRFHAGAALRPVTDWRHYNHGYTANILNTPAIDPEAYRLSSPIEYAEALRAPLLIGHGMLDDNVFYQDAVMLAQRLIDLGKQDWELASYPLERHGYVMPQSWLDQYRRIHKLFLRALAP